MTSVLFVCRRPPWPLTNGARIRSHRLVEGLARSFDTVLLTMDHRAGSPDGEVDLEPLRAALPDVEVRTVEGLGSGKRLDQLRSLTSPRSWSFGRYATEGFGQEIMRVANERRVDVIHADDLGAALALPDPAVLESSPLIAYASHNVESRILGGDARAGASPVRRAFASVDYRKLRAEEARVTNTVDLTFAVSEHDAEIMRAWTDRPVAICPNGTDQVEPTPLIAAVPGEPLRLVFVGSAAYAPYERGLAWFGREVMPILRADHEVAYDVVGQRPQQASTAPEIVHRGFVDEVASWYARAHGVVVPVFEGSGTRLKLVEAAAHGRPIVTTRLGAQGLPLQPGVHYLEAETPAEFAAQIGRLAGPESFETMVDAARQAIEPLLWPTIAASLAERYRRELSEVRA